MYQFINENISSEQDLSVNNVTSMLTFQYMIIDHTHNTKLVNAYMMCVPTILKNIRV